MIERKNVQRAATLSYAKCYNATVNKGGKYRTREREGRQTELETHTQRQRDAERQTHRETQKERE